MPHVPDSCRPWGRGWCAAGASILEASAPKPGNVHPAAAFDDLTHAELVAAGLAIAPALERAADKPLGRTILAAVTAARAVTRSNANLGIVLAIAPLAAVPEALDDRGCRLAPSPADIASVLARLTPSDADDVWQAIRLAQPGGMGTSPQHDLSGPAPADLLAAMRLAAPHDTIARLWTQGYDPLFTGLVADLDAGLRGGLSLNDAIVEAFLGQLEREPDSLIIRKHGPGVAIDVSKRAAAARGSPEKIAEFDRFLRSSGRSVTDRSQPHRLNPGTSADLTAAALYILLYDGRLRPSPTASTLA